MGRTLGTVATSAVASTIQSTAVARSRSQSRPNCRLRRISEVGQLFEIYGFLTYDRWSKCLDSHELYCWVVYLPL